MPSQFLPIDSLRLWDKNPRSITRDAYNSLKTKIQRWGQFKPVICTPDGEVIGGNMRLRAYQELGIKDIWVSIVNPKNEAEKLEIAITDNEASGRWQEEQLAEYLEQYKGEIKLSDYQLDLGEPISMDELLQKYSPELMEDEPPDINETQTSSILGEIYQLGRHKLMCGDSTKIADLEKLMDGKQAAMVFTDPPYNIDYQGGMGTNQQNKREGILNDKMSNEQFYKFLYDAIKNMMSVCNGVFYVCMSSQELPNLKLAFENAGGHWQSFIIWVKNQFTLSRSDYQNQYEPILYGWNKKIVNHYFIDDRTQGNVWVEIGNKAKYDGIFTTISIGGIKLRLDGKVKGQILKGKRKMDIWRYDKPIRSDEHPTMKPVALCGEAIRNSSKVDDIVLDVFGGSGSTLIAAEQSERIAYLLELDPKYCDVIRKRYAKFIGKEEMWQTVTPIV